MPLRPMVSVILPAWNSHQTITACLDSLRSQTFSDYEVILVDSSAGDETARIVHETFPEIRFVRSPRRLWPHSARNLGASIADGEILVFSDPDCIMSPQWLEQLVNGHRERHRTVGGSVSNAHPGWFLDGVHLCKYAWWMPGGKAGERNELPSANVSYSRTLFDEIGPFPEEWCGDTLLAYRSQNAGVKPWFKPDAKIAHDHRTSLREFLIERFERGYDYGLVRPRLQRWSRIRMLAYVMAAPLIVLWLLIRAFYFVAPTGFFGMLVRCLPVVTVGYTARQVGEAVAHWRLAWQKS